MNFPFDHEEVVFRVGLTEVSHYDIIGVSIWDDCLVLYSDPGCKTKFVWAPKSHWLQHHFETRGWSCFLVFTLLSCVGTITSLILAVNWGLQDTKKQRYLMKLVQGTLPRQLNERDVIAAVMRHNLSLTHDHPIGRGRERRMRRECTICSPWRANVDYFNNLPYIDHQVQCIRMPIQFSCTHCFNSYFYCHISLGSRPVCGLGIYLPIFVHPLDHHADIISFMYAGGGDSGSEHSYCSEG